MTVNPLVALVLSGLVMAASVGGLIAAKKKVVENVRASVRDVVERDIGVTVLDVHGNVASASYLHPLWNQEHSAVTLYALKTEPLCPASAPIWTFRSASQLSQTTDPIKNKENFVCRALKPGTSTIVAGSSACPSGWATAADGCAPPEGITA
jgi:hypothetical protein